MPENEKERTTKGIYGHMFLKQFAQFDQDSHSWKTFPAIGLWGSIPYSQTWPRGGAHVWWTSLRASDVGAPHHRERVFILAAYPGSIGQLAGQLAGRSEAEKPGNNGSGFPFSPDRPVSENMEVFGRYSGAVRRWERASRLDAPEPVRLNSNGKRQLNAEFPEWMMGLERGWVTSPDIGLPRMKQIKAIGNGVCPKQAEVALRYLLRMVNETDKTEVSVG